MDIKKNKAPRGSFLDLTLKRGATPVHTRRTAKGSKFRCITPEMGQYPPPDQWKRKARNLSRGSKTKSAMNSPYKGVKIHPIVEVERSQAFLEKQELDSSFGPGKYVY